jgi:hypothetical protein
MNFQDNLYLRFRVGELESEVKAKEEERHGFLQCFEKLTSEKLNLVTMFKKFLIAHDHGQILAKRTKPGTSFQL